MKLKKISLSKQLVFITIFSLIVMVVSLAIVLPKSLEPYFEQTVYSYLDKPLEIFEGDDNTNKQQIENIVYIQEKNTNTYVTSNYQEVLGVKNYTVLLKYIKNEQHGKFTYNGKTYYYSVTMRNYSSDKKIAITTDAYIKSLRTDMLVIAIPVVVIIFLLILVLLLLWSDMLVKKIEKLKLKIDNFQDPNFDVVKNKFEFDDELKLLDTTIDNMKDMILSREKYQREMYQNISHDFKTPIMVVKSYAEAYYDGIEKPETVIKVSEEQMNKLEKKVKTLLELNKITYLQNSYKNDNKIDVLPILENSIEKYKIINKKLKYEIIKDKNEVEYPGTLDMWESIFDNLLNNAERYANDKIVVTVKSDKIVFFNDGKPIEDDVIDDIFKPYKKGVKGENGLGLSIVKGNCDLLKCKVYAKNKKDGVTFTIEKQD